MTTNVRKALQEALTRQLAVLKMKGPPRIVPKKLALSLYVPESRRVAAELTFIFLARADAVYLTTQVTGGALSEMLNSLALPSEAKRSDAVGTFFVTTLSETNSSFTADLGGAHYFYPNTDAEELAAKLVGRLRTHYLSMATSVLLMDTDLPGLILSRPDSFSYPLTSLALLERLGRDGTYSRIRGTPAAKKISPKESALDIDALLTGLELG